jgi:hypothetical protein
VEESRLSASPRFGGKKFKIEIDSSIWPEEICRVDELERTMIAAAARRPYLNLPPSTTNISL